MAFGDNWHWFRPDVVASVPLGIGCYGIAKSGEAWLYIGSGNVRARLTEHLRERDSCIHLNGADAFTFDLAGGDCRAREAGYCAAHNPICNERRPVGGFGPTPLGGFR